MFAHIWTSPTDMQGIYIGTNDNCYISKRNMGIWFTYVLFRPSRAGILQNFHLLLNYLHKSALMHIYYHISLGFVVCSAALSRV